MQVKIPLEADENGAISTEKMKNLLSIGSGIGRKGMHVVHLHRKDDTLLVDFAEGPPVVITVEEE